MTDALRFDRVTFTYKDGARPALDDVSLDLNEGTFALATGPTGSGKSTFLRAADGLVPHFSGGTFGGHIQVEGRDTLAQPPRALADVVAFVPQDPVASFVLDRVEEELAYGMENLEVPQIQMRRRVEEMLDLLAIAPLRARSVHTLSGGEQQRVAIAAALATGPRLLVLDEPTSQLDPQGAEDVLAALQRLVHDHGMTVLVAEHRLERVVGFADIAIGFDEGRVSAGTPADVIGRGEGGPPVTRLGRLLGWRPTPLTVREARARAEGIRFEAPSVPADRPAPGEPLLRADGLAAGHEGRAVIQEIDLQVARGEIVAVMGRNGSGKTTLLRCLAGLHEPIKGAVTVTGRPPDPGVDVALCPQEPESVLYRDSVSDEIRTTLRARGREDIESPEIILERFGIRDLADRHPRDCSAGQRLLIATAAIVATGAPVLLLDEPTRGLDPASKRRLAAFLQTHAADGNAAVFATHDVELAAAVATRVVMIAAGDLIADGTPSQVLGDSHVFAPQMTRVFGPGWLTPEQVAGAVRR